MENIVISRALLERVLDSAEDCADLLAQFQAPVDSCVGASMIRANAAAKELREALQAKPVERKQMKCIYCDQPADFTHTCPRSRGDDIQGHPV